MGGRSIGRITWKMMRSGPAPHTWAADSSDASLCRKALAQNVYTMGASATASVRAMPGIEYRFHGEWPRTCCTLMLTNPDGPYIMIQPKPRMSEEMKNGHCMAAERRPPPGTLVLTT